MSTSRSTVAFGWDFDHGEFAFLGSRPNTSATRILRSVGFTYQRDLGGYRLLQETDDPHQQIALADQAIQRLVAGGHEVRNWHAPVQTSADVVRHYAWLQNQGPFPDATTVASAASAEARLRLSTRDLPPTWRAVTEEVADGRLRVEARRVLGDVDWMLATVQGEPDNYLILRHDLVDAFLGVTDHYARWYAGQARRDFRVHILRETRVPKPPRAHAATRATMSLGLASSPGVAAAQPATAPRTQRR